MSFLQTITRLRDAVYNTAPEHRMRDPQLIIVRRRDLRDLIHDWESLDNAARERHRKDFPEHYPPTGSSNVDP